MKIKTDEQVNKEAYRASLSQYGSVHHDEYESTANGFIMGYNDAVNDIEPKWIDVDDRHPDDYTIVLVYGVYYEGYTLTMAHMADENWFSAYGDLINDVTHWMPLPNPPKSK